LDAAGGQNVPGERSAYDSAQLYEASVAVHVASAVVGFGAVFTYPVIQLVAERRDRRSLPLAIGTIRALSTWVAVPATTAVGLTGIYQVTSGPYGFGDAWVALGLGLYGAVMALGVGYLAPAYARAERESRRMVAGAPVDAPIALSPEYRAAMRGPRVIGPLLAAAILATVVLMEVKPG
jgi:uncharacterized membrane protein